ncbi:SusC/RagA family TonB-linked outer membrane protein [Paraflavitalea sp. CAU 1676]|uniref:SusC/RagA family TonB-linked outer membrane protein n=1 Tax=Paraflavitalea sp. CAU 1676 TaxID=3032598 RepID=UPI0023DB1535|nr:SusC/RagA family TonB-linked outer membrane protein [Paraflavitalea sp. CAU 1676]MDF2192855.1 SusC/RagA family TonB-linked outer membrane protein [Paraflavitalea sp. CAU 1676]
MRKRLFERSSVLCYYLAAILLLPVMVQAQQTTIRGTVTNQNSKEPLSGISVVQKGTTGGTSTDAEGKFVLAVSNTQAVIVFSGVGFESRELSLNGQTSLDVKLTAASINLNEVVVIGYGTQTKKDLTGAVAQVKATQLENENPASVQDVLRGNVPGMNISQVNAASAKGGGDLLVRGKTSINAGTTPLIVLDGVIYQGQLSDINPNDINTIDVLKDASSAAVFGAKAASGVVLITTKRGSKAKPTITFNTNIGFSELAKNEELYGGPGFVAWRQDVQKSRNNTSTKLYTFDDPRNLPAGITMTQWRDGRTGDSIDIWLDRLGLKPVEIANYKKGETTNWYDMMFQRGLRQDHTVSLAGKKDEFSYYWSLGYTDNEGIIVGDRFKTFRTRINLEGRIAKYLTTGLNLQFADRDESQVPVNWGQMVNASPYGEVYNADDSTLRDSPNDDIGNNSNPFADNTYTNRLQKNNTLFGSIYAKGNLPFGFSYQVNFTPSFDFYRYFNGVSAMHPTYRVRKGIGTRTTQTTYNWQVDNLIKWDKTFGQHQFNVTMLWNVEKFQSWREQMDNEGFDPKDVLSYSNIGSGIKPIISSDDQVSTGDALMARLNYVFNDRYILTASYRRDGYSAFGQRNPRAGFPAAALAWVVSEEDFMKDVKWLNYGKFRISYGINGNRDVGRYQAISDLTSGKYQYINAAGVVLPVSQLWTNRMANPNLKWEKTASFNLGLDFGVLNNRLSGSVDVYEKSTQDMLVQRALPTVIGFDYVMYNIGKINNKGIEIALNSVNIDKRNFSWRTTLNFWLNRNKIVSLYGPVNVYDQDGKLIGQQEKDDQVNRWFIGKDIDVIWDQKVLGVWQESEAVEAKKYGVYPGDFKVEDVNGDFRYSNDDRQFLGFRSPRFQWTMRQDFTFFRSIDFGFSLYSSWGQMNDYNQAKNNSGFQDRQNSYKFPYWTAANPISDYARLYSSNGGASFSVYRKTSFIRLNTISLAYTLPKTLISKARLESAKVYANVTNAGIYAPDWTYWDPEFRNRDSNGAISTAIAPRIYTLGLNVTF